MKHDRGENSDWKDLPGAEIEWKHLKCNMKHYRSLKSIVLILTTVLHNFFLDL